MKFNFRTKLAAIAGTTAIGFLALIAANFLITRRVEGQLDTIHGRYIPLIELGPKLEAKFARINRGLQDAVAAHDREALEATSALKSQFLEELVETEKVISPERIASLRLAVEEYYKVAQDVSRRLMEEETGESLVDSMNVMKAKHEKASRLLQEAIVFDQGKLTQAFSEISSAQATAGSSQLIIGVVCLFLVAFLTLWISRGVLLALSSLTKGISRFGKGDFAHPIPVITKDELGDVANQANQMALQIQSLLDRLSATNKELEAFSYSVAHDLRAPLRASIGFSTALLEDHSAELPPEAKSMLNRVAAASRKMGELIDGLLSLSRISRNEMTRERVNLSTIAETIVRTLQEGDPERKIDIRIEKDLIAYGDSRLLHAVLANLIGNAWKFTNKKADARIEFGSRDEGDRKVFFVRDNGAGFDMRYSEKLFGTFQRLHAESEFEGTGIGLATVQRIIHRHNGKIWAKAEPDQGATFSFTLG